MNTIEFINTKLNQISKLESLEKFDFLISTVHIIESKSIEDSGLIKIIITNLGNLRYEMAYSKVLESISGRLDKVLAYAILNLSRKVFDGGDLKKAINDVLYYEINDGYRKEIIEELAMLD